MSRRYQKVEGSKEMISSSHDVFAKAPTHTSTLEGEWVEYHPTAFSKTGDVQFHIPASSTKNIDLSESYAKVSLKIVKEDGTDLDGTLTNVKVFPNDCFIPSLFKTVTLYIDEVLIESETNYPTRGFIENLLNYSKGAKTSKLKMISGWHEDTNLCKDGDNATTAVFETRADPFKGSASNSFITKLHLNMFNQQRDILPRNSIKIFLERTSGKFSLMGASSTPTDGGKVEITQMSLFLRSTVANPAVTNALESTMLMGDPARYPIQRVETKVFTLPTGSSNEIITLQGSGHLPGKVIVGLINQQAINGDYKLNPFRFVNYEVNGIELKADGHVVDRFTPNFANNDFAREYFQLLAINKKEVSDCETMSPAEYLEGRTLFAFDLTGDRKDGHHLMKSGNVELKVNFARALPHTVSLFSYMIKDDTVLIDVSQRVSRTGDKVGS